MVHKTVAIISVIVLINLNNHHVDGAREAAGRRPEAPPPFPSQSIYTDLLELGREFALATPICRRQLGETLDGIASRQQWAIKMLESSGRRESLLYFGNVHWLGSAAACRSINHRNGSFPVAYLVAQGNINFNELTTIPIIFKPVLHLGLCIPAACTDANLHNLTLDYFRLDFIDPHLPSTRIEITNIKRPDPSGRIFTNDTTKIILTLLLIYVLFCLLSEWALGHHHGERLLPPDVRAVLNCFSFRKNWRSLVKAPADESRSSPCPTTSSFSQSSEIVSLHLFRTIACLWIMLFHLLMTALMTAKSLQLEYETRINPGQFGINYLLYKVIAVKSVIGVEFFFVMGGFNLSFNFLKEGNSLDRNEGFNNLLRKIALRYSRLAPIAGVLILLTKSLDVHLSQSHYYRYLGDTKSFSCENWWWNLLFLQNFVPFLEITNTWTWYLACDFQFYVIHSVLLFAYRRYPRTTTVTFFAMMTATVMGNFCLVKHNNIQLRMTSMFEAADLIYTKPWSRILTYQIGIVIGFVMDHMKRNSRPLNPISRSLWTAFVCLVFALGVLDDENNYTALQHQLGWSVGRLVYFTVLGSAILLAESGGPHGLVNRLARSPFVRRFSRVSYCFYMCHCVVLLGIFSTLEENVFINNFIMIGLGIVTFLISYPISIVLKLLVEQPFVQLANQLLQKRPAPDVSRRQRTKAS